MKINISLSLLLVCSFLFFQACRVDEVPEEEETPPVQFENSNLEVKVQVETDTGLILAIGAQIKLYENQNDRMEDFRVVHEGSTNAFGKYTFNALANPEYWVSVKNPYDGQVKFFYDDAPFATPGHPVILNKLDVVFEQ
ncbi:MAG: hypothetical protein AAFZ15_13075 [Bacteroidota bacterium]